VQGGEGLIQTNITPLMPTRLIREGFLDSERVNTLTAPAECFYHRLLLAADDYGRFDARAQWLRSRLWPVKEDVRAKDVETWLADSVNAGLVQIYNVDGKDYGLILNYGQRIQSKKSKFPEPTVNNSETPKITEIHGESPCSTVENREARKSTALSGDGDGCGDGDGDGDGEPPIAPLPGGGSGKGPVSPSAHSKAPAGNPEDESRRKDVARRLNELYRRREATRWSEREVRAMRKIWPVSEEDLSLIEAYYTAAILPDKDIRRRDLLTLLNNWPGEVDRARKWADGPRSESVRMFGSGTWEDAQRRARGEDGGEA
jgi:hypothetical protein